MSVIAAALRHMLAANMDPEAIVAAVAAMEAEMPARASVKSSAAIRQARYRHNKASQNVTDVMPVTENVTPVTLVTVDAPPSSPPDKSPPYPQKLTPPPTPPRDVAPARKGHRISEEWEPEPLTGKAALMVKVWPPGALERELAKFRNYWLAKSGQAAVKNDWQRTWVNWLISADERIPKHERNSTQVGLFTARPAPGSDIDAAMVNLGFGG